MDRTDEKIMASIRRRGPLEEPFLKASRILDAGGMGNYLSLCNDRIADAELIDGEDVRIDFLGFPDMDLTAAGVRICRKVLECYVPGDIIEDAHEALCGEKSAREHVNIISQMLRTAAPRELFRTFIRSDARIRRFVAAEICQRLVPVRCYRRMRGACCNIFVRIKYHGLLSAVGTAARNAKDAAEAK